MPKRYFVHNKTGYTGVADLPNFATTDMKPPRSFEIWHDHYHRFVITQTNYQTEITKEVYDIMRGV